LPKCDALEVRIAQEKRKKPSSGNQILISTLMLALAQILNKEEEKQKERIRVVTSLCKF